MSSAQSKAMKAYWAKKHAALAAKQSSTSVVVKKHYVDEEIFRAAMLLHDHALITDSAFIAILKGEHAK